MAKLQIPLNGSNIKSKSRRQAFHEALEDEHRVDCREESPIKVASGDLPQLKTSPQPEPAASQPGSTPAGENDMKTQPETYLNLALEHTYKHQARTMEIHQQYLAQQTEYIQLITAVLDQQGRVLDHNTGEVAAQMLETFQKTLDSFHAIREQGNRVHQTFLEQQAAFSERFIQALGNGRAATLPAAQPAASQIPSPSPVTEWVVKQPPIVVDDYTPSPITPAAQESLLPAKAQSGSTPQRPGDPAISAGEISDALLEIVAEKTGYPAEMLELDMDLEADLGIDSIKRVEILSSLEERYPALPPADMEVLAGTRTLQEILSYLASAAGPAPNKPETIPQPIQPQPEVTAPQGEKDDSSSAAPSFPDLEEILLQIVAEKTGYPADMVETDMDLEADLGIDSIKRVEILGAMEERVPGLPPADTETLAAMRTLGQIVEYMNGKAKDPAASPVESSSPKKKEQIDNLEQAPIGLTDIPEPDQLVFRPDPDRPLILTDDGTEFTQFAAEILKEGGWTPVIWHYPGEVYAAERFPLAADLPAVRQEQGGAEGIQSALEQIRTEFGVPSGFIHLHPAYPTGGLFSAGEGQLLKLTFLLAGALKQDLNSIDGSGRNLFLAVVRSDGSLGLSGEGNFQEGLGLAGLVKTLRWEWDEVFCRFLDISQELDPERASRILLREILDPDRSRIEIGRNAATRVTIQRIEGQS